MMMTRLGPWTPPGYRFDPTDEQLLQEYLIRKCEGLALPCHAISDSIDPYSLDPCLLPELVHGKGVWNFFSARNVRYTFGTARPNRAVGTGYWKDAGLDMPIGRPTILGIKKWLFFYIGEVPNGVRTNWVMNEYSRFGINNPQLEEWVVCKMYNTTGEIEQYALAESTNEPKVDLNSSWNLDHQVNESNVRMNQRSPP